MLPDYCLTSGPITLGPQSTFTIKFPSLILFISQTKGNDSPQSHLEWVEWCHKCKQGVPRGILTPMTTPFPRGALPKENRRGKGSHFHSVSGLGPAAKVQLKLLTPERSPSSPCLLSPCYQ